MKAATLNDIPELRRRLTELGYKEIDFGDTYGVIRGIVVDGQVVRSPLFDLDPAKLEEQERTAMYAAIDRLTPDHWIELCVKRAPPGVVNPNAPKVVIRPSPLN